MAILVRKMLQLGVHLLSSFPGEVQDVVLILQRVQPGLSQASALKVLVFVVQKGITALLPGVLSARRAQHTAQADT